MYSLGSGLSPNHLWPQFLGPALPHSGISVDKYCIERNGPLWCPKCVPGTGHLSPVGSGGMNQTWTPVWVAGGDQPETEALHLRDECTGDL